MVSEGPSPALSGACAWAEHHGSGIGWQNGAV